jgi:regulator of chromosome condensation
VFRIFDRLYKTFDFLLETFHPSSSSIFPSHFNNHPSNAQASYYHPTLLIDHLSSLVTSCTTYLSLPVIMAPKKAAGSAPSKSTTSKSTASKPAVNGITTARPGPKATKTTKKAATKAPAKTAAKPAAKSTATKAPAKTMTQSAPKDSSIKVTANTSRKRKAADEEQDEPQVNGVKRQRTATKSATSAPAAPKRKAAAAKAPAVKKPKKKTIVNTAPTDRLDVYVFGEGSSGELGLGSAKGQTEVKRPRLNPNLAADTVGVVATSVGGMHAAALTHDNKILTWGVNDQAALGRNTAWDGGLRDIDDDKSDSDSDSGSDTGVNPIESTPGLVDMSALPDDIVWTQVEATDSATFALTDDGLVYGWGTFRVSRLPFVSSDLMLTFHSPTRESSASILTHSSRRPRKSSKVSRTSLNSPVAPTTSSL